MSRSEGFKGIAPYINEFTVYSLLGWLYETVCESIFAGSFVLNQGFLRHLPLCPIYGAGAFIAVGIMSYMGPLSRLKIFIGGTLITTVVEYIAALILEGLLDRRLWDYTPWILDFQGRISLISSLIFGLGCLFACWLRPRCREFCKKRQWTVVIAALCLSAMLIDFVIVVAGLL